MADCRRQISKLSKILLIFLVIPIFCINILPSTQLAIPNSSIHLPIEFNATQAYEDVRTQLEFGYRVPGTMEHNACADWMRDELQPVTDIVVTHNFSLPISGKDPIHCQNILGKLNTNQTNIVILAAHWDSRAIAEKDTVNTSDPIPGANDGASGVAVILELARVFYQNREEFDSQIWFLLFDAEDQGSGGIEGWYWAEGANAFSEDLDEFYNTTTETFSFFILLDMVGGKNLKFMDETNSNNELQDAVFQEGRELGYLTEFPKNPIKRRIIDDHIYFTNKMPTLDLIIDFIAGPWTYHHTHQDNLENIDINSLKATGSTIESFIYSYHGKSNWKGNWTILITTGSITGIIIITVGSVVIGIKMKKRKNLI